MPVRNRCVLSAITTVLLICLCSSAFAQTGRVSVICTDPNNQANRIGFDLDYDARTIIGKGATAGKLLGVRWGDDTIEWTYECVNRAGYVCEHMYFNRRTGVLTQVLAPANSGTPFVCAKSVENKF